MSPRETVELFHLAFLGALGSALDKKLYAVKGGVNLRFFHGSPRASEDLDLDVHTVEKGTLRRKVEKLLAARPLELRLATKGIAIEGTSAPKQTETTQRWRVQLRVSGTPREARTKIEMSRRGLDDGVELGPVDPVIVASYGVSPVMAPHYGRTAAIRQKILALAGRAETQSRDVFDLDYLLRRGPMPAALRALPSSATKAAVASAMSMSFDHFAGQVLPFLGDEDRRFWDRSAWDDVVLRVTTALSPPP
jgi:Nucleotidyl transferase AbiEii toxin, Type IV TA system